MQRYYIKNNLIFSSLTEKIKIIDKIDEIEIPSTTKSHIINNKILITDIEKLLLNAGRNFEISKPVENFDKIKEKIIQNKNKLKKITSNDYDFIEKTSGIEIIKSILNSVENSNLNLVKEKIQNYIEKTKKQELQKSVEITQAIEIEKDKINEIKGKKEEILSKETIKKLEKLEIEKKKIEKGIEKKEIEIINYKNHSNTRLDKIFKRQEEISNEIQDLKHLIKIKKNEIKSLKAELKLGKNKKFNWITSILMILTLGLIYWSKFTDTKYYILKNQKNIAKFEEKISKLEHEKFNLEKEIKIENKKSDKKSQENNKKEENIRKEIDDLNIKLEKNNKEIIKNQDLIKKENTKIKDYEKDISKIDTKIMDLEITKKEFEKYSTKKIQKRLDELITLKEEKISKLEKVKEKIKSQKISIDGEYIVEL